MQILVLIVITDSHLIIRLEANKIFQLKRYSPNQDIKNKVLTFFIHMAQIWGHAKERFLNWCSPSQNIEVIPFLIQGLRVSKVLEIGDFYSVSSSEWASYFSDSFLFST